MDSGEDRESLIRKRSSMFTERNPLEIAYQIQITAKLDKKTSKVILHSQKGVIPAESFTAIMGPSGSGKTTFLNFMAGRSMTNNLTLEGWYKVNGQPIRDFELLSNYIGYVMQEDALLGTLTPKECFEFAANMKLKLSKQTKMDRVQELIEQLGLKMCQNTKIGNAFIKGVSGGERKRTSIGIQLITNPNIIFLDEPTTGLDSTTALQCIQLLSRLSKKGKTIISTIHQPSSELFAEFDRLMLLVDGRCIFAGPAAESPGYFASVGYQCPELMNPSEFYLEMISLQGAEDEQEEAYEKMKAEHDKTILKLQQNFKYSKYNQAEESKSLQPLELEVMKGVSIPEQFALIFMRSLRNQIRNPIDVTLKFIQSVFISTVVFLVFGQINNDSFLNFRGIAFFVIAHNCFSGINQTLATFSGQRPVFLRERFSQTYSSVPYFLGRTLCNMPFQLLYPTAGVAIIYWATGLADGQFYQFLKVVCVVNVTYFFSAGYGLIYSTVIPKLQTAMSMVPVLIIPFMLLGGFFINLDQVHDYRVILYPVMYMSPFKYSYQAMMLALNSPFNQPFTPDTYSWNIRIMVAIGIFLRIVAMIAMKIVSSPRRPKLRRARKKQH